MYQKLTHLAMPLLVMAGVSAVAPAAADEIRFQCAAALRGVLESLLPAFEQQTGHKVVMTCGNVNQNAAKMRTNEKIDLLMVSPAEVAELRKTGEVESGILIAKAGTGIAVRKGAPKPDVSSVETFKKSLLSARAIALNASATGGPSGVYAMQLFQRLGIAEQLQPKLHFTRGGRDNASALTSGLADIAISQVGEILAMPELELVGPFPDEVQNYTELAATIPRRAESPRAAEQLRALLTSPEARSAMQANGLRTD